jgi:hypothetical protein
MSNPNKSKSPTKQRRGAKSRRHELLPTNGALKLNEARAYLGNLSKPTMYRLIKRGLLKANRSTRYCLFARTELDRFIRAGMI